MIDWYVEGTQFGTCNCAYGCPCQFEALPTYGHCEGFEAVKIDTRHFGDIDLSGTVIAALYHWPAQTSHRGDQGIESPFLVTK